jgi:hypothetical protein
MVNENRKTINQGCNMIKNIITGMILFLLPTVLMAEIQWQTTHGNLARGQVRLERNTITVTVYPDYLDVEEEAVISTLGNITNSGDPNSLEIYGPFTLTQGSAIVGMLLWNGDVILKAKLKPRIVADQQYEDVVDRNIVPPVRPRDPALIEYMGNDTYQMKIYPVRLGNSRKIRLRYHVPCTVGPDGVKMNLRPVFGANINNTVDNVVLKLLGDDSRTKYKLNMNGMTWNVDLPFILFGSPKQQIVISERQEVPAIASYTEFFSGRYKGTYLNLYAGVPDEIMGYAGDGTSRTSLIANIGNEYMSYSIEVGCEVNGSQCEALEFHGKSNFVWNKYIRWQLYDASTGNMLQTVTQHFKVVDRPSDTAVAVLWASSDFPFAETDENYMGARYGFIDESGSLLALEDDSLGREEQERWELAGVPRLTPVEIVHPDSSYLYEEDIPDEDQIRGCMDPSFAEYNPNVDIHDPSMCFTVSVTNVTDASRIASHLHIGKEMVTFTNTTAEYGMLIIVDVKGKIIYRKTIRPDAQCEINLFDLPAGKYFIRIKLGRQTFSRHIVID